MNACSTLALHNHIMNLQVQLNRAEVRERFIFEELIYLTLTSNLIQLKGNTVNTAESHLK